MYYSYFVYIFVGKYLQLVKLIENKNLHEAAELYIELLKSDICPK